LSTSGSGDDDAVSPSPTYDAWVDAHETWSWIWTCYPEVPTPGIQTRSLISSRLVQGALFSSHLFTKLTNSYFHYTTFQVFYPTSDVKDHLVFWAKLVKQMASNKEL
jgi:hypothetical protein